MRLEMSGSSSLSLPDSKQVYLSVAQQTPTQITTYNGKSGVVAAGGSLDLYAPIPTYEGKHRYDPNAVWTEMEEQRLVRRVTYFFPTR